MGGAFASLGIGAPGAGEASRPTSREGDTSAAIAGGGAGGALAAAAIASCTASRGINGGS
jgi:hypothetical protein